MHFILFSLAYLVGSIPFGLILSKIFSKKDIRTLGSGNIGATNVLRSGHPLLALSTLILDAGKGAFAVYLGVFFTNSTFINNTQDFFFHDSLFLPLYLGFIVILGHIFPIFLKFKGGKGVATALGATLMLSPMLGCIVSILWCVVAKMFRISSLSALVAFAFAPCVAFFFFPSMLLYTTGVFLLLLFTHRSNIKRLLKGKESTLSL